MSHLTKDLVILRTGNQDDISFIYATWLQGLYYGNDLFRQMDKDSYFKNYHQILDALLIHPGIKINVAALKEDPEVVLGYCVYENTPKATILHWIFTKPVWRKLGIATDLIPKDIAYVTHMTKIGKSLKPQTWKFDPFLI